MTSSTLAALRGAQAPSVCWSPPAASSAGAEAVDLARMAGLDLDPWQELVLERALGERADGQWAAMSVGLVVSRQNGKGSILEARELAGLFLLGERLITHTAHRFDTSLEAFERLLYLIEENPDFDRRVQRVSRAHGKEGITLKGRQRIRFRTRTKSGGRGFSGDCVIFDEAMDLPEATLGALMPTLSARPNPQLWYMSSAVDQLIHEYGVVLARLRQRGLAQDPTVAYFEWLLACTLEEAMQEHVATDPQMWAGANPGLGIRITPAFIAEEQRSMDARTFAVERLGVGDWPATGVGGGVIDLQAWRALTDTRSQVVDPVCFAIDVRPDRSSTAIAAAGKRADGLRHMEIVDKRPGTSWVVDRAVELTGTHKHVGLLLDPRGPAASLLSDLNKRLDFEVTEVTANEHAQACGMIFDAVEQKTLRHLGTPELDAAIKGAGKRTLGDAWAWSRTASSVDISPLVAGTLALWGSVTRTPAEPWVVVA